MVKRKFKIQLGRLRETSPILIVHKVTSDVTFVSNATISMTKQFLNDDRRVFLFNGIIYNRNSFFKKVDIIAEDQSF